MVQCCKYGEVHAQYIITDHLNKILCIKYSGILGTVLSLSYASSSLRTSNASDSIALSGRKGEEKMHVKMVLLISKTVFSSYFS